jgi:hypothetical protein
MRLTILDPLRHFPFSNFGFPISILEFRFSSFEFPVSNFQFRISDSYFPAHALPLGRLENQMCSDGVLHRDSH